MGADVLIGLSGYGTLTVVGIVTVVRASGKDHHIHAAIGDGESDEGLNREGSTITCYHNSINRTMTADCNYRTTDGNIEDATKSELSVDKPAVPGPYITAREGNNTALSRKVTDEVYKIKDKFIATAVDITKGAGTKSISGNHKRYHGVTDEETVKAVVKDSDEHSVECTVCRGKEPEQR